MKSYPRYTRRGFTLVEMLVVVVIIVMLAAIIVPAVWMSLDKAKNARIRIELAGLEAGVEAYKNEYGSYPPDFNHPDQVTGHFQRIFPRSLDTPPVGLTEAQALVFCLRGYYPDPEHPLFGDRTGDLIPDMEGNERLFDFNETQVRHPDNAGTVVNINGDTDGNRVPDVYPIYVPRDGRDVPYVYFDGSRSDGYRLKSYPPTATRGTDGAQPYRINSTTFANANSFQIISAGQDGRYGEYTWGGRVYPSDSNPAGVNITPHEWDNLTNFGEGTIEDAKP